MKGEDGKTLILSFMLLFLGQGISFFTCSLFLPYLAEANGWGRGITTLGFAGYWVNQGLFSILTGILLEPLGLKRVVCLGVLATGLGYFSLAFVSMPVHLVFTHGTVGLGVTLMGMIPVTTLLARQFPCSTGRALGIAGLGLSIGGLLGAPLIERSLTLLGWQGATIFLAIFTWIGGFLVIWLAWPREIEYMPGLDNPWRHVLRGLFKQISGIRGYGHQTLFWWVLLVTFIGAFGPVSILNHIVAHFLDLGIDSGKGALALSFALTVGIGATILIGFLADRMDASLAMMVCFLSQAVGLIILMAGAGSGVSIFLFLLFFGFGMGPSVSLHATWVLRLFGLERFQQAYPVVRVSSILGATLGPIVAGYTFDISHSYQGVFVAIIAIFLMGALVLKRVIYPRKEELLL